MSLRFTMALALSIWCYAVPAWTDVAVGLDAYNRGDYATAENEYRKAAQEGNATAQYNLGVLYAFGRGGTRDYGQARQWWEKAAA